MLDKLVEALEVLSTPQARKVRVLVAVVLLLVCLVNTPISIFTYAKGEPVTVLLLSWTQLLIALLELITASQVHKEQGENGGSDTPASDAEGAA